MLQQLTANDSNFVLLCEPGTDDVVGICTILSSVWEMISWCSAQTILLWNAWSLAAVEGLRLLQAATTTSEHMLRTSLSATARSRARQGYAHATRPDLGQAFMVHFQSPEFINQCFQFQLVRMIESQRCCWDRVSGSRLGPTRRLAQAAMEVSHRCCTKTSRCMTSTRRSR